MFCWRLVTDHLPAARARSRRGDVDSVEFVQRIETLARLVRVRIGSEAREPSR